MLANSPSTGSPGHVNVETYFYDLMSERRFDRDGRRRESPRVDAFGSQTFLVAGVAEGFSLGLIGVVGFTEVAGGPSASGLGLGDQSLMAQVRLSQFQPGRRAPTTAINLQQSFPTGTYDRLGERPSDGLGSGAYTTTLGYYAQTFTWMPNGRILRWRFNGSQSLSSTARVEGVSVYGTGARFRGHARPGASVSIDLAAEYSLTRSWVLASDLYYRHNRSTRVTGTEIDAKGGGVLRVSSNSGSSDLLALAPAIEYCWRPNLGVLIGARLVVAGRRTSASYAPVFAINYVR
jgi:hypothetical protein